MAENGNISKDLRSLIVAALASAAVVIVTPRVAPELSRPDPMTGTDFKEWRREHIREFHESVEEKFRELLETRIELEILRQTHRLPPEPTRRRIEALEDAMRELVPGWSPGSNRFTGNLQDWNE